MPQVKCRDCFWLDWNRTIGGVPWCPKRSQHMQPSLERWCLDYLHPKQTVFP